MLLGSMIPNVGFNLRLAIPVLACIDSKSNTATPVVSLPLPDYERDVRDIEKTTNINYYTVVGTAINVFSGP